MSKLKTLIRDAVAVIVTTALAILAEHYVSIKLAWVVAVTGLIVLLYLHELHTPIMVWLLAFWSNHVKASTAILILVAITVVMVALYRHFDVALPRPKFVPTPENWAAKQPRDTNVPIPPRPRPAIPKRYISVHFVARPQVVNGQLAFPLSLFSSVHKPWDNVFVQIRKPSDMKWLFLKMLGH